MALNGVNGGWARLRGLVWWRVLLSVLGLVVIGLALATAWVYPQLPSLDSLEHYQPKQPLRVFSADGVEIAGFGSERRVYQRIDQIPQLMKDALLAVEDARFYTHGGIDPVGVARALVSNLTGGRRQGASTITQQVARTFLLTRARTVDRKFKEALLSLKIESQLSKDQVLELYMNQIYLGSRAYGFEAAAQTYFGKTLAELTAAECAMLAGLPQNPHYVNPIRNFDRAKARQLVVLSRMREVGVLTEAQWQAAKVEKLQVRKLNGQQVHAEYVAEIARQQVYAQYGEKAYTLGFSVTTTLRAAEQQAAYKALRRTLIEHELRQPWRGAEGQEDLPPQAADDDPAITQALAEVDDDEDLRAAIVTRVEPKALTVVLATGEVLRLDGAALRQAQPGLNPKAKAELRLQRGAVVRVLAQGKQWVVTQWPQAEGALVALDPANGEVRALVGGFDFHRNQFNHVTQGWRQPGSSFKPFIYAGVMDQGLMPESLVNDAPMTGVGDWDPQNSDGSLDGPITLREALARSKNLVSIRLVQLLGVKGALDWTARFGFDPAKQPDNLTLALGAGSTTPLQLASAYAVIANGGYLLPSQLIRRITTAAGEVIFEAPVQTLDESLRVVPERNTYMAASLLQEVTRSGTAARAQGMLKRPDLYGKTGTTNDVVDAWFAGFQPGLVAVVWLGHDQPRSLGSYASGSSLALPAWIEFMATALKDMPVRELAPPEGAVHVGGDWRYAEWAQGGFIATLGLDDAPISPSLIPKPPAPADAGALAPPPSPTGAAQAAPGAPGQGSGTGER